MAKRKFKSGAKVASSGSTKRATVGNGIAGGGHQPKVHPALDDCYPLNKLCRLCLLSNTNMEPIFTYTGDIELSQRIFQCTGLEIHENEDKGIPTAICGQCRRQLDQSYEFRTLCWKNNDVLHNLNLILSPKKNRPTVTPTMMSAVPIVQVEKLQISPSLLPKSKGTPAKQRGSKAVSKNYGEVSLSQLYTPTKRGHKVAKIPNQFSRELVICLTPMSPTLVNKYKKKTIKTVTKAAMKSFPSPQPPKSLKKSATSPRKSVTPLKIKVTKKKIPKPAKTPKSAAAKKSKAKPVEIAVPPKKRKQNFEPVPEAKVLTISCSLCSQTFNNMKNLARHTAAHENNRKQSRVFNCDICQKEYLKASQLTDHLRSAEHVENAANNAPDEADVSILPDEQSILPDTNDQQENISTTVASPTDEVGREVSPDEFQPSAADATEEDQEVAEETNRSQERPRTFRQLSPISVASDSPTFDGVQYSDVCSTNNEDYLLNSSATRRVSFAEVTEILD